MEKNTYAIHCNGHYLFVDQTPIREVANNGLVADAAQAIRLHVSVDGDVWAVLTSNADHTAIGYIDEWGNLIVNDDVDCDTWFESFGAGCEEDWLRTEVGEAIA